MFFGGARGGGKTDGVLGKWALKEERYGRAFNARMFRRNSIASEDAIDRAKQIYIPLGAKFSDKPARFRMPHGGRVAFDYLDTIQDADNQQGKNLTDAWVEEAGQYADPSPIDRLFGALRSAEGVPIQMILTGNPGGVGQHWLAARYKLIPFPNAPSIVTRDLPNGAKHHAAVIPSRITDNKVMLASDPEYINRLQLVGSPALVRAWLEGDWSAIEGAFFPEWSEAKHVIAPFSIPDHWTRFRSGDWGSARPFSIGWWAVVSDDYPIQTIPGSRRDDEFDGFTSNRDTVPQQGSGTGLSSARPNGLGRAISFGGKILPRGALVRYREWYGASAPNTGLKLTSEAVAAGIVERERFEPKDSRGEDGIIYGVMDPAAFSSDGGPSIAERMAHPPNNVLWRRADNARVSRNGAMGGWDQVRARLVGDGERPMMYFFSTCRDAIRTLPALQHDRAKAEDVDTDSEDHCFVFETKVDTVSGPIAIGKLGEEGFVWSTGERPLWFRSRRLTGRDKEVVRLHFEDGRKIVCTPSHNFVVGPDEMSYAQDLQGKEVLCRTQLSFRTPSKSSKASAIISAVGTFREKASAFTSLFGGPFGGTFQRAIMSTTGTTIGAETVLAISNVSRSSSICQTGTEPSLLPERWSRFPSREKLPAFGTVRLKDENGTAAIMKRIFGKLRLFGFLPFANIAGPNIKSTLTKRFWENGAAITARRVRCVRVERLSERRNVYCLTVPQTGIFSVEGGFLVANSPDEIRYACMSRPYVTDALEIKKPKFLQDATLEDMWDTNEVGAGKGRI